MRYLVLKILACISLLSCTVKNSQDGESTSSGNEATSSNEVGTLPELKVAETLNIVANSSIYCLGPEVLNFEGTTQDVIYTILTLPNDSVLLNKNGAPLQASDTFLQSEINTGDICLTYDGGGVKLEADILLSVSDSDGRFSEDANPNTPHELKIIIHYPPAAEGGTLNLTEGASDITVQLPFSDVDESSTYSCNITEDVGFGEIGECMCDEIGCFVQFTPYTAGVLALPYSITDESGESAAHVVSITVTANDTIFPSVSTGCSATATVGNLWTCSPLGSDPDFGSITWELSNSTCDWLTVIPGSGQYRGTPTDTGTCSFDIKVVDDNGYYGIRSSTLTITN